MLEATKDSDKALAELATVRPFGLYEIGDHGLLAAQNLSCRYEIKRYMGASFPTRSTERDLLQLSRNPAADLLLTVLLGFRVERSRNFAGSLVVSSAVGVFGGLATDGMYATHVTYGSRVEDREKLTCAVSGRVAYAHELIVPPDILSAAQAKEWDYTTTSLAANEWTSLVDLIELSDKQRS